MDWAKIRRNKPIASKPAGVYTNLDDLIRIQFKARNFSFLPKQAVSSILSGRYASRLRGRGLNFEEIRRYTPGDDIRTMDWKVTARTRSPHVRVYTEEKDRAVLLIVDQRLNMFFGTKDKLKSVTAAELAALGAWRGISVGDRVGAIVFNDTEMVEIKPAKSQKAVMSILGTIVRMNHALSATLKVVPNEGMLNKVLKKAMALAPHDALVVVVSDCYGCDNETQKLTAQLAIHNDVLCLLVHDPIRLNPFNKQINVTNGSLHASLDLSNKTLRNKLTDDYRKEQEEITYFLQKLSAPLLMVSNQGDTIDQIKRLLGRTRFHK